MTDTLTIKLTLDQVRIIDNEFFPYLRRLCELKIRDAGRDMDQILNCRMVHSLFLEVERNIERKLLCQAKRPTLKFTFAQAVVLCHLLLSMPIDSHHIYLINLRSFIKNELHKQLMQP